MGAVGMMILMMTISEIFCLELHENLRKGEQPWVLHNGNNVDDEDAWIWKIYAAGGVSS
jgi:hypothetical protein